MTDSDSGDWQIPVSYYWKNSLRPDSVTLAPHERPLHTKTRDGESFLNSSWGGGESAAKNSTVLSFF